MHGMTPLYLFLAQMSGTYQPPPLRTPSGKVSLPLSLSLSPPPPPSLSALSPWFVVCLVVSFYLCPPPILLLSCDMLSLSAPFTFFFEPC